ncbi:MAG: hypothetical protein KAT52_06680 [Desulfobacterales bacterium]|nr:hypothetical protein [Desulfobacterales bacterium]
MKLSDYRETYYEFSGIASEVSRKLSFAGIALVWLFKIENSPIPKVPNELIFPTGLLALSLSLDLMQYIAASVIWGIFQWYQEKKLSNISENPELSAPPILKLPQFIFFSLKILAVMAAYIIIIKYILVCWEKG